MLSDETDRGNLFTYCENNTINRCDLYGFASNNVFWAGFGVQIEIGGSLGFIGRSEGFEIIWYTSDLVSGRKRVPYAYRYSAGSFGLSGGSLIDALIDKLLKNPKTLFSTRLSFSASICALSIWGYKNNSGKEKKFHSPDDYLGIFKTRSITIYHVKSFYSTSSTCFSIGAGYDASKWAISNSISNYKYCSFFNKYLEKFYLIYNYIYTIAKAIKA